MRDKFLASKEWKDLRQKALQRDNCKCFLCGSKIKINVHHILYRKFFKELRSDIENLICVCNKCHFKIHKSIGNIFLIDKLKTDRPQQYKYIIEKIKS